MFLRQERGKIIICKNLAGLPYNNTESKNKQKADILGGTLYCANNLTLIYTHSTHMHTHTHTHTHTHMNKKRHNHINIHIYTQKHTHKALR